MFLQFNEARILQDENYHKVPLECPVCYFMMKRTDIFDYQKNQCCSFCSMMLVQPNKEKWKKGWRPSKKEIIKVIKNRKKIPSYIVRGL